jgi:hypothetical protein
MAFAIESSVSVPTQALSGVRLRLPHPYLTEFLIESSNTLYEGKHDLLRVKPSGVSPSDSLPSQLQRDDFLFTLPDLTHEGLELLLSDNTPWARSQRAHQSVFIWDGNVSPTLAQAWLAIYALFTTKPEIEIFRLKLSGAGSSILEQGLLTSALAYEHPKPSSSSDFSSSKDLVVSRSAFWQGAASPFGARSPWTPECGTGHPKFQHHIQPRPKKPTPGSIVYSRYIPSLNEHFSLIALDYNNDEHVQRFHKWQNDPRVAKGWNETGTLEEHKAYLKRQHDDPHTFTVFGRFNDICFSYFELYWAKEDNVGLYYDAGDFDRGRHSLVGDARYRGRHRVLAWWSCIIHYLFLDDHRTNAVIGEPNASNNQVLIYDYIHGLHLEKWIDFPHKRAALVKVSRERFFQISPFNQNGATNLGFVAGTGLPLPAKL